MPESQTVSSSSLASFNFKENSIINKQQLKELINRPQQEKNFILIDVRNKEEICESSMIPSAINIPLDSLKTVLSMDTLEFKKTIGCDKFNFFDNIIFYCRSGRRSSSAIFIAKDLGYSSLINYSGSYIDWISN